MNLYRALIGPLQYAVIGLGGIAVVVFGVYVVSLHHEAHRARQAVCAAKLEAVQARNLFTRRYLLPSDPCAALRILDSIPR